MGGRVLFRVRMNRLHSVLDRNWHLRRRLGALALTALLDAPVMTALAADPMDTMMTGALGSYSMTREASGTSWQPDSSAHSGVHVMEGDWMFMGHSLLNGVYDWQQGPRGDTDTFVSGMVMGMVKRHFESGDAVQFRAMMSPEPLMGKSGY